MSISEKILQAEVAKIQRQVATSFSTPTYIDAPFPVKKREIKKDCFAYSELPQPSCKVLTGLYCMNEECKFYKSQAKLDAEREKSKKRLKGICKNF